MSDQKYYHIFTAGKYPQGDFSDSDVKQIAELYDDSFCEAFLCIGHTTSNKEVESLGWIKDLMETDGKLYASFSHLDPEAVKLVNSKKFKRCSVELVKFENINGWYLYAVALTNTPQIKNLEPLEFSKAKMTERVAFSINASNLLEESNQTKIEMKISNAVKKFAESIGIQINNYLNDQEVLDYAAETIQKLKDRFADDPATVGSLTMYINKAVQMCDEIKTLKEEAKKFKENEIESVINLAIAENRIVPAQSDALKKFAQANFDAFKEYLDKQPKMKMFESNVATNGKVTAVDISADKKFFKQDGTRITYEDIRKNPKLAEKFNSDELVKLRSEDAEFK